MMIFDLEAGSNFGIPLLDAIAGCCGAAQPSKGCPQNEFFAMVPKFDAESHLNAL